MMAGMAVGQNRKIMPIDMPMLSLNSPCGAGWP
jgi:hypothetical protein